MIKHIKTIMAVKLIHCKQNKELVNLTDEFEKLGDRSLRIVLHRLLECFVKMLNRIILLISIYFYYFAG